MDLDDFLYNLYYEVYMDSGINSGLKAIRKSLGDKVCLYTAKKTAKYHDINSDAAATFVKSARKMKKKSEIQMIAKYFDNNIENIDGREISSLFLEQEEWKKFYKLMNKYNCKDIPKALQPNYYENILDVISGSSDSVTMARILAALGSYLHEVEYLISLDVIQKYSQSNIKKFGEVIVMASRYAEHNAYMSIIELFDDYQDKYEYFCDALLDLDMAKIENNKLRQLFSKRAALDIEREANPTALIKKIISKDFGIEDDIFDDYVSYKDIELVENTLDFVLGIHEERSEDSKLEIEEAFYDELNRAMDQGTDEQSRIQNLREYCRQVRYRMEQNADELMVMHDGS